MDHNALDRMLTCKNPNERLVRWIVRLNEVYYGNLYRLRLVLQVLNA